MRDLAKIVRLEKSDEFNWIDSRPASDLEQRLIVVEEGMEITPQERAVTIAVVCPDFPVQTRSCQGET